SKAQLKYLVDDFEGMAEKQSDFKKEGIFSFGSAKITAQNTFTTGSGYSGHRSMMVNWSGRDKFGGWGIGLGRMVDLNPEEDYFNFYIYAPTSNKRNDSIKISIEEDDNANEKFEPAHDETWNFIANIKPAEDWQLISIPLQEFYPSGKGGDKIFNTGYKGGVIFSVIFTFSDSSAIHQGQHWYFDFISFSKGPLPTGQNKLSPPPAHEQDYALLGAWSEEGNSGNFNKIASTFEGYFNQGINKKLGVVHLFQPFASGKDVNSNQYPSVSHLNEIISLGYVPMITLENHYVEVNKNHKQPNLYSIIEGHYDFLFYEWTERIKKVDGPVLIRILHEFNGDWYPWCISQNENQPWLYIEAYKRIVNFFKDHDVNNAKFVWCPNSMSIPQASWNYIMDAYPGDDYVDFVALDIYNGAGEKGIPTWRSFRKEGIENYQLLTEKLPHKPLLICEISSRERMPKETGAMQDKAGWIEQMAEALMTDFSKVRLIVWFNEYDNFKINSSEKAKKSFSKNVWQNSFFRSSDFDFIKNWSELTTNE
nr:hypothetical protein [Bacteroidota bacterium]